MAGLAVGRGAGDCDRDGKAISHDLKMVGVPGAGGIGGLSRHALVEQDEAGVDGQALGGRAGRGIGVVDGDLAEPVPYVSGLEPDRALVLCAGGDKDLGLALFGLAFVEAGDGDDVAVVEAEPRNRGADPQAVAGADLEIVLQGLAPVAQAVDADDGGLGSGIVVGRCGRGVVPGAKQGVERTHVGAGPGHDDGLMLRVFGHVC